MYGHVGQNLHHNDNVYPKLEDMSGTFGSRESVLTRTCLQCSFLALSEAEYIKFLWAA